MCLWAYADSEGPDQPTHPRSLIRVLIVQLQNITELTESLDIIEFMNREQRPGRDFAHACDESEYIYFAHARRHIYACRGPNDLISRL